MAEQTAVATIQYQPDSWEVIQSKCQWLVESGFLPKAIDTPQKAAAIALKGSELGIPVMEAFSQIHVVQGKPTCSAELQLGLLARGGVTYEFLENDQEKVIITFHRPGFQPYTSTFTMEDAKRAQLLGNPSWKKYPGAMLRARAISAGARVIGPDLIGGMSYTPEELGATVNMETGEVLHTEGEVIEERKPMASQGELDKLKSKAAEMAKDGLILNSDYNEVLKECNVGMERDRMTKYIERFGQIIKDSCKATDEEIQSLINSVDKAVADGVIDEAEVDGLVSSEEPEPTKGWVKSQIAEVQKAYEKGERDS